MIEAKDLVVGVKYFLDSNQDLTGVFVRKCEVENFVEFQTNENSFYGKNEEGNIAFPLISIFKYTAVEE